MQGQQFQDPLAEEVAAQEPCHLDLVFDPMIQESQGLLASACCHPEICYPDDDVGRVESPVYVPVSSTTGTNTCSQEDGAILLGPGVQLPVESQVAEISHQVTRMDIDVDLLAEDDGGATGFTDAGLQAADKGSADDARHETEATVEGDKAADPPSCAAFCKGIFKEAAAPLLPRPATTPRQRGRGHKKVMVATRSSLRQAARPSPVPVSQRAQWKLMRELQFIDTPTRPPDAAVTEYIDLYGQDLPAQAIEKLSVAAGLGNKQLVKVLAALAAEAGAVEMEAP